MKKSIGEVLEKIERERISRIQRVLESNSNRLSQHMIVKSGGGVPCKGIWFAPIYKFSGGILLGTDLESLRTGIEATANIGDKWLITEQTQLPVGTDIFQRHTGQIAEFVGSGNGEEGSSWNFITFKSGSLISFDGTDTPWYIIVEEVGSTNFPSGKIAIPYIDVDITGNPPDIVKLFTDGYSGVKTNRSKYTDKCRSFQLLYTEDFIEYTSLPTIYQESRYLNSEIITTGLFPPEAIGFGVRWLRGGEQFDRTF